MIQSKPKNKSEKTPRIRFYTPDGVKRLIELIDNEINDPKKQKTQNSIASAAGISPSTLSQLRVNLYNTEGTIAKPPNPETVLDLANQITDPDTGLPFSPWKLLALCCGFEDGFPGADSSIKTEMNIGEIINFIDEEPTTDKELGVILEVIKKRLERNEQIRKSKSSLILLLESHLKDRNIDLGQFAAMCKLGDELIYRIIHTNERLKPSVAESIANGLNIISPGWSKELIIELDRKRFSN